ncbi:hypothetical protein LCGC14_0798100 [marine sediment metagenome]
MVDTYPMPKDGWTCFHCGEAFKKAGAAADHFGDDPTHGEPACVLKLANGDRGLVVELRKAVRRGQRFADKNESLEYQLDAATRGYARIAGARNEHEAFMEYDAMEGRALTAEAIIADMARRVPAMVEASRRRVCSLGSVIGRSEPEGKTDA